MDVVSYNVDLLKEGKITGIVDQGAFNDGYMAVKALYELLTTGELKEYKEGINYLPDVIVSKANLAEYEPLIQEALDMQKEQMESAE